MIHGFSDVIRIPRLGKIRLGIKAVSNRTGKEYPKAVDYFVCPPEVQAVYADQPKELDIMVPYEDIETVFPTSLKRYGSQFGLKCSGDGRTARETVEGTEELRDITCRYEDCPHYKSQDCKEVGNLHVILPRVKGCLGIYQIDTTSFHSVTNIKNGLELLRRMVGRISMIPLVLEVKMQETHPLVNGNRIQSIVPVMNLKIGATMYEILDQARQNKLIQSVQTTTALLQAPVEIEGEPLPDDVDYLYPKVAAEEGKPVRPAAPSGQGSDVKTEQELEEQFERSFGTKNGDGQSVDSEEGTEKDKIDRDIGEAWAELGRPTGKLKALLGNPDLDRKTLLDGLNSEIDRRNQKRGAKDSPAATPPPPPPPSQAQPPGQTRAFF